MCMRWVLIIADMGLHNGQPAALPVDDELLTKARRWLPIKGKEESTLDRVHLQVWVDEEGQAILLALWSLGKKAAIRRQGLGKGSEKGKLCFLQGVDLVLPACQPLD